MNPDIMLDDSADMSSMADDNADTNPMVSKVVAILIALLFIVVLAFPIANSLSDMGGNGGEGGESGDSDSVTVSNEQYVLSKMDYAEHPIFDINVNLTDSVALDELTYEGQTIPLTAPSMAIIYADAQTVVYLKSALGSINPVEPMILHINTTDFDNPYLQMKYANGLSRVVSDGTEVTVYYTNNEYTFEIASQCYYSNPNGLYGCYVNPQTFTALSQELEQDDITYTPVYPTSLYIPEEYNPHIVSPMSNELMEAYENCGQSNIIESWVLSCVPYYTIADGQITNAGWNYEIDEPHNNQSNIHTGTAICTYMILPNSSSTDEGGDSSGGTASGIGGVAGTLIKLVPILMIIGLLMMFIIPMVYKPN